MTIPETPFSGCDCCGYGFEMFESVARNRHVYCVTERAIPSEVWLEGFDRDLVPIGFLLRLDNLSGFSVEEFGKPTTYMDSLDHCYTNGIEGADSDIVFKKFDLSGNVLSSGFNPDYSGTAQGGAGTTPNPPFGWNMAEKRGIVLTGSINEQLTSPSRRRVHATATKFNSALNEVVTVTKTFPDPVPAVSGRTRGYAGAGICADRTGNFHITGVRLGGLLVSPFTDHTGHFEISYDKDGNELWSDISTNTNRRRNGVQCTFLDNGNVICRYAQTVGTPVDSVRLVGYDPSGSRIIEFSSGTISPDLTHMVGFGDSVIIGGTSFLQKRSGSLLATVDWTQTVSAGFFTVDDAGDVYYPSGGSIFKRSGTDGSVLASESVTYGSAIRAVIPPGVSPLYI
jgi:hypothetical protein